MRELSLFSGAGGGLLGTKLLGWKHCGYVEFNDYCQRVIRQRILDGILENAPIFGDIRTFINEGYAASYQGMVDVVTAGFPCQPFSVAGKQQGETDSRNMWPETLAVIRAVRPRYALLENVPGLLAHEYARRIFGDLAESGFDARWRLLSAAEMGAPHKRDRVWIYCYANKYGKSNGTEYAEASELQENVADTCGRASIAANNKSHRCGSRRPRGSVAGMPGKPEPEQTVQITDTDDTGLAQWKGENSSGTRPDSGANLKRGQWWTTEPDVGRVAHGVADRVDKLKALGNGQVPAVVAAAWSLLNEAG